jgi:TonB family protein
MFDKLIESNTEGAEFKKRRSYFLVSSVIVGALFLAAVVASIYAADFGLGTAGIEVSELLAPAEMADAPPEQPRVTSPDRSSATASAVPSRQVNIDSVETSQIAPDTTSVTPNAFKSRPNIPYTIGPADTDPPSVGISRDGVSTGQNSDGLTAKTSPPADVKPIPDPPPAINKPAAIKSLGVVNGIATSLPKPAYPATAIAMNIKGKVDVQVLINESGKVISSHAINGHPMLRANAERAALTARFTPTLLSNVPVKVTGVIVYNFMR